MGADRDIARLKYLLGFLAGEFNVFLHIPPEGSADVYQLGAVLGALLLPVPEYIQVLPRSLPDRVIVDISGAVGIPLKLAVVIPDVGDHPAAEVGIAGDRLLAQQVLQLQYLGVHWPVRAVQHRQLQGIVLAGDMGGDKLYPYPQILAQRSEAGTPGVDRATYEPPISEQLPQLLLKEITHFPPSFS